MRCESLRPLQRKLPNVFPIALIDACRMKEEPSGTTTDCIADSPATVARTSAPPVNKRDRLAQRWEQTRQAKSIHGGWLRMSLAATGVRLANMPIPSRRFRRRVFQSVYGSKYGELDETQLTRSLEEYRSLNELFTRDVAPSQRPITQETDHWLSPADGRVQAVGRIEDDSVLRIKECDYSVESLVPSLDVESFCGGQFLIGFLSPVDCHRVFCPAAGVIDSVVHVPGRRLLVHPPYQSPRYPVFTLNERVIIRLQTESGPVILVMVAGWGVGNITFPSRIQLPTHRRRITTLSGLSVGVDQGQWLATFALGSTVILLLPRGSGGEQVVDAQDELRYGQPVITRRITPRDGTDSECTAS